MGQLSWGRLHTLLDATIIEADQVGAEQRAALAAQERFVRLGRSSEHGLKMIIARATAGDAIWFKATINRIADILTRQGDNNPADTRRSKAIGILAQRAQALQLLYQHQDNNWDRPEERADPETAPDLDQNDPDQTPKAVNTDTTTDTSDEATHRSLQTTPPPLDPPRRGSAPSSMCTSARKPSTPVVAWPGSKTSGRYYCTGYTPYSVIIAASA